MPRAGLEHDNSVSSVSSHATIHDSSANQLSYVGFAAYTALRKKHRKYHHRLWNITSGRVVGDIQYTPKGAFPKAEDPKYGHDKWFPENLYELMIKTEEYCDIMSLSPPDGIFKSRFKDALFVLHEKQTVGKIRIRMLFGHIIGMPVDCQELVKELTDHLPRESTNIQLWVGAWRKGVSWNHAKIVAVDGQYLHTGGHNLWDYHYLKHDPVHDVSIQLEGKIANDAHLFANEQWGFISRYQNKCCGGCNAPCTALAIEGLATVCEFPPGVAAIFPPELGMQKQKVLKKFEERKQRVLQRLDSRLVRRISRLKKGTLGQVLAGFKDDETSNNSQLNERFVPIVSIGRTGTMFGNDDRPSDDAIIAMLDSAETIIRLALQDLGPVCLPGTKMALPGCVWPKDYLEALGRVIWTRGTDVEIVLSNPNSIPGGLTPMDANYGNGWSCVDVAAEIIKTIKVQFPDAGDAELRQTVDENLRVCFIRTKQGNRYKDGMSIGLHSKFFMVDDICCYVGSQNLYVCDLAEWGVVIDDGKEVKKIKNSYWDPMWATSFTGEDCDVQAVMDGLNIDRDGEDPDKMTTRTRIKMDEAMRIANHANYRKSVIMSPKTSRMNGHESAMIMYGGNLDDDSDDADESIEFTSMDNRTKQLKKHKTPSLAAIQECNEPMEQSKSLYEVFNMSSEDETASNDTKEKNATAHSMLSKSTTPSNNGKTNEEKNRPQHTNGSVPNITGSSRNETEEDPSKNTSSNRSRTDDGNQKGWGVIRNLLDIPTSENVSIIEDNPGAVSDSNSKKPQNNESDNGGIDARNVEIIDERQKGENIYLKTNDYLHSNKLDSGINPGPIVLENGHGNYNSNIGPSNSENGLSYGNNSGPNRNENMISSGNDYTINNGPKSSEYGSEYSNNYDNTNRPSGLPYVNNDMVNRENDNTENEISYGNNNNINKGPTNSEYIYSNNNDLTRAENGLVSNNHVGNKISENTQLESDNNHHLDSKRVDNIIDDDGSKRRKKKKRKERQAKCKCDFSSLKKLINNLRTNNNTKPIDKIELTLDDETFDYLDNYDDDVVALTSFHFYVGMLCEAIRNNRHAITRVKLCYDFFEFLSSEIRDHLFETISSLERLEKFDIEWYTSNFKMTWLSQMLLSNGTQKKTSKTASINSVVDSNGVKKHLSKLSLDGCTMLGTKRDWQNVLDALQECSSIESVRLEKVVLPPEVDFHKSDLPELQYSSASTPSSYSTASTSMSTPSPLGMSLFGNEEDVDRGNLDMNINNSKRKGGLPKLEGLFFCGMNMPHSFIVEVARSLRYNYCNLKKLNLSDNQLCSSSGIALGKALNYNVTLESLWLADNTELGDDACIMIAKSLVRNKTLTMLDLTNCGFGDKTCIVLAKAFLINKTLNRFHIQENKKVTRIGYQALNNALKQQVKHQLKPKQYPKRSSARENPPHHFSSTLHMKPQNVS